ncbi:hypothetical protein TNCV_2879091 [Trichonephila clavipes]|uniref:Uncharacterized protein n=1 Tax=Trichonephila clavipes TaxID=2585209 RepID=A0A8X6W225_TRICX|nr:hypothetical protein TNCV_2879091 [Trichonephila clavipes]
MADCLSNGEAAFRVCVGCETSMIALSRVARGSFLIGRCVNVVTSVPVRVPSTCTGSEASRVRTGQWGSPIGSWVFVNFCVHEVCERMMDVD